MAEISEMIFAPEKPGSGDDAGGGDSDREQKRQEYTYICDHNTVEGAFGTLKTACGLGRLERASKILPVALLESR